jgi:hypothetical protein
MLNYKTSLQNKPPVSDQYRADALAGLRVKSPYTQYGSTHDDILMTIGDANAAQYDIDASKANADYQNKQQEAERQLVLQGLQMMDKGQQNQNSIYNTRLQNMTGFAGNLLGGLFS